MMVRRFASGATIPTTRTAVLLVGTMARTGLSAARLSAPARGSATAGDLDGAGVDGARDGAVGAVDGVTTTGVAAVGAIAAAGVTTAVAGAMAIAAATTASVIMAATTGLATSLGTDTTALADATPSRVVLPITSTADKAEG